VMRFERMRRSDGDIVEKTEAHRRRTLGMMAGGTNRAERIFDIAGHHQVNRLDTRTGSAQSRLPGISVHRRIRVQVDDTQLRRGTLQTLEMGCGMHAFELLEGRRRRFVIGKVRIQPLRNHVIADGVQALRSFRMIRPHVVQLAVAVADECSAGHCVAFLP